MQSDLFHFILLHLVGLLFNVNYDARNHELKIQMNHVHLALTSVFAGHCDIQL